MLKLPCSVLLAVSLATWPSSAGAQGTSVNLRQATLEELMDVRVTSAARKSQRAEDVPAAIYVISQRDIAQSGLITLPEILRLAPGVQVAQVSAGRWAISIRGFNSLYSNKLLVLIDGRSVYSRTFSGVFWDLLDVMVSDIARIEVIRGGWRRRLGGERRQRRHQHRHPRGERNERPGRGPQRGHPRAGELD